MIDHIYFLNNISGSLGGGLYTNIVTTTITVSNSVFSGNTAWAAAVAWRASTPV